ncbi:MAG: alpha/beta fold hydrolase [Geitlerinemataceae cyanobacterium]
MKPPATKPPAVKQFVQLDKYRAAYTVRGSGRPVILLHGFFGDSETLGGLADELKSDFQCFSLELLGFGDSEKPDIKYLVEDQVEFLRQFIEKLNLKDVYLLGYSYGAWVSAAYAIAHPSDLGYLGLLAPAGIRDDSFVGKYDAMKPLLWPTPLIDWAIAIYKYIAPLRNDRAGYEKILLFRTTFKTQPAATAILKSRLRPEDAVDTVEHEIHRITTPTIVVAAEQDETIPYWHSETYAKTVPNAEIEVVPDGDHGFIRTHSTEIAQILKPRFQARNRATPGAIEG